jgi:oligopeptide/dipeptide ABC transporter ATP-binding protein
MVPPTEIPPIPTPCRERSRFERTEGTAAAAAGAGILVITHDVKLVEMIADRVAVLYAGRVVEQAPASSFILDPLHPYSQALVAVHRAMMKEAAYGQYTPSVPGDPPSPDQPLPGCAFAPRCPLRFAPCSTADPHLFAPQPGRTVRCYLYDPGAPPA